VPNISDQRLKHLEFIQAVITRMAGNSMAAKGWSVALTAALVGLASAQKADARFVILALLPPIAFWTIDAYYMYLERCYRDRFDAVNASTDATWSGFDLTPLTAGRNYVTDGLLRPAVFGVHLLILVLAFAAWWMLK
jgi:hypothetical protein